jgi:hypothetical protein
VGEDRSLGSARRPRRIHDERGVAAIDVTVDRLGCCARDEIFVAELTRRRHPTGAHEVAHADSGLGDGPRGLRGQRLVENKDVGPGVGQNVADLGSGKTYVKRHCNRADLGAAQQDLDELARVEQEHGDPIAAAHAECDEGGGDLVGAPVEVGVGDVRAVADQRGAPAVEEGAPGDPMTDAVLHVIPSPPAATQ